MLILTKNYAVNTGQPRVNYRKKRIQIYEQPIEPLIFESPENIHTIHIQHQAEQQDHAGYLGIFHYFLVGLSPVSMHFFTLAKSPYMISALSLFYWS